MSRSDALAAGLFVSVGVFAWLAGPIVEAQFGTEALIATYAGVACAAGAMTYAVWRRVDAYLAATSDSGDGDSDADSEPAERIEVVDVDQELDQLREE